MAPALREREELIESRARTLVELAVESNAPWQRRLGPVPTRPREREFWITAAKTVAAYRDRHQIEDRTALGPRPVSIAQRLDYARAEAAIPRAQVIAQETAEPAASRSGAAVDGRGALGG